MHIRIKILCASLLALTYMSAALSDTPIYKWTDDKGQVHYSTVPHSDNAQQLAIQNNSTPHAGTAVTPVPGASTDPAANDPALLMPQAGDSVECKAGRDRLSQYLHADNLYSVDDKGNHVPLTADDKKKAMDTARAYVKQVCGGGS
jgi:hypothetical protein